MKKKHIKELKRIAIQLPVKPETKGGKFQYGSDLIAAGTRKDKQGEPINPKMLYNVAIEAPIDHVEKMKAAYKKGGAKAVQEYIKQNEFK